MIDLGNRRILTDGTVICKTAAVVEMLYQDIDIDSVLLDDAEECKNHNHAIRLLDSDINPLYSSTVEQYSGIDWYQHWTTPEQYTAIDIKAWCLSTCRSENEIDRVIEEYSMFEERDMIPVLRHLLYIVDTLRQYNITWGVGRGSSVSSYILYLIGINRINPLDFGLDVREFLK